MPPSFFLVQWMPGPCTEPGTSKEFSIIGIEDIREDYRYALDKGRITMATYRFSSGPNVGTLHRLCKILYTSGDKSALEVDLMAVMNSGEDGTAVYTIEDEKPNHLTLRKQSVTRPPPWEVEKEMVTLLEETHKVRRENEELKAKLAQAVDVGDLKNILETTILNIQQKQIIQPSLNERRPSSTQASQPPIESVSQGMDPVSRPQLPSPNMNNRTFNQGFPVSPPGMQRNTMTRQTPPMNHQMPPSSHVSTAPTQQQHSRLPESEMENPYIVRVQSLADQASQQRVNDRIPPQPKPAPQPVGIRSVGLHDKQGGGTSGKQEVRRYMHPSPRKQQKIIPRQRQIKTPQWQANYVSDGITERLRIGRTGQNASSSGANSLAVPVTSTHQQQQMQMQQNIYKIDDQDGDKLEELVQGSGIWLPLKHLKMSQRVKGLSQYTRKLVMLLFNMKELSTSSVTGFKATGKGSENAIARPALDPKRVQAIITAVKKRFPQASPFKVKQVMSQKLMDIRKTVRNKMIKNATWKQNRLHHGIH